MCPVGLPEYLHAVTARRLQWWRPGFWLVRCRFLLQSSSRWGLQVQTVELERTQYYYYLVPLLRARNTTTGEAGCDDRDLHCSIRPGNALSARALRAPVLGYEAHWHRYAPCCFVLFRRSQWPLSPNMRDCESPTLWWLAEPEPAGEDCAWHARVAAVHRRSWQMPPSRPPATAAQRDRIISCLRGACVLARARAPVRARVCVRVSVCE